MEIEKIDANFAVKREIEGEDGLCYYEIPHPAFDLYGVFYEESTKGFCRFPSAVSEKVSEGVHWLNGHTAGGRLRFSTDSSVLKLKVEYCALGIMSHMTLLGQGGFVLLEETEYGRKLVTIFPPAAVSEKGFEGTVQLLGGKMREYILYFPLYNPVGRLQIGLDKSAKVEGGKHYKRVAPILYYGSSITQGGCASRPDNCYQAFIEKWNNVDFINLGFSGSAKGEDVMVDYLASIDCSLFVCDYDHNAPSVEHLKNTHYRLYERYRNVRKDTPILFITKPDFHRDPNGKLREDVIRSTYQKAKKQGDNNVYFIAGKTFFDKALRDNCTVDGCHPNDLGFYKMAKKIYEKMQEIDPIFR
ncbi:MAG: hypothetical protein IJX87_06495 [Clostridia bacterium]|nr:hypothetical protein [Clostridia bacterium]